MDCRPLLLALLLLPFVAGTASACSLVHQPFDQATWEDRLRYVDGASLRERDGLLDRQVVSGFFITYAAEGDRLVVSGQDGLGADCSGDGWFRVYEDGRLVRSEPEMMRVFDAPKGAVVVADDGEVRLLPWDGGAERRLDDVPDDVYVTAWSAGLRPAYVDRGVLTAGGRTIDVTGADAEGVAPGPPGTGAVVVRDGTVHLHALPDDAGEPVRTRNWPAAGGWPTEVRWAGGWNVLTGGELFVVKDAVHQVHLDVEPVALGVRGDHLLVFHDDGYVELDGTRFVRAETLQDGRWRSDDAEVRTTTVAASPWSGSDAWEPAQEPGPLEALPAAHPLLLLVALFAFARRR